MNRVKLFTKNPAIARPHDIFGVWRSIYPKLNPITYGIPTTSDRDFLPAMAY